MRKIRTDATLPRIKYPIIVEGRYDKSAILGMFSANVITTDGFGIFNSREKQMLVKKLSRDGIILLTDSDGGGRQIRSFIAGILPPQKIYQLYIPKIKGKEKRKAHGGKEGFLGVEGVGGDVLREVLAPFISGEEKPVGEKMTSLDMFDLGLSGTDNSQQKRDKLCAALSLPDGMSAKALLGALNIISSREEVEELLNN